jgi:hypothetical protein
MVNSYPEGARNARGKLGKVWLSHKTETRQQIRDENVHRLTMSAAAAATSFPANTATNYARNLLTISLPLGGDRN